MVFSYLLVLTIVAGRGRRGERLRFCLFASGAYSGIARERRPLRARGARPEGGGTGSRPERE